MIIACPSCETRFEVNAAAFPPAGRKVKCARCGHIWHATMSAAAETPAPVARGPAPESSADNTEQAEAIAAIATPTVLPQEEAPPERIWAGTDIPPRRSGRLATMGATAACLILVAAGLYLFRDTIVAYVPGVAPAYAALGVPVDMMGLDLTIEAQSMAASGDGAMTLVVTGAVANGSSVERPVPKIRATLLSKDQAELHSWTFDAGVGTLKPGERHEFRQELAQPPGDTYQVYARFAAGS